MGPWELIILLVYFIPIIIIVLMFIYLFKLNKRVDNIEQQLKDLNKKE